MSKNTDNLKWFDNGSEEEKTLIRNIELRIKEINFEYSDLPEVSELDAYKADLSTLSEKMKVAVTLRLLKSKLEILVDSQSDRVHARDEDVIV